MSITRGRTTRLIGAIAGTAVIGGTVLAGCGSNAATPGDTSAHATTAPGAVTGAPITLTTTTGTSVQVPTSTPTVLFFFTGECGTCVGGARSMSQAQQQTGDSGQFLGVDMDPSATPEARAAFLEFADAQTLPVTVDDSGALAQRYQVRSLGTTVVVASSGTETFRGIDPSPEDITAALRQAQQS